MKIKTIFLQTISILILFSYSSTAQTSNDLPRIKSKKIKISIEKGENKNEIVFKLTNEDTHIYHAYPIISAKNKFFFTTETGKKIEHHMFVSTFPVNRKVQPGDTMIRKKDITSTLMMHRLTDKKNLKMIWSVKGLESNSLIINQED